VPHDSDRDDFNWAWPLTDIEAWQPPRPMRGMQVFGNGRSAKRRQNRLSESQEANDAKSTA
jgi:hypothetical protein